MSPAWNTDRPIVIIGAGFAGLLLAQGLHKNNIPFVVYEQDELKTRPGGHRFRIDTDGTEAVYDTLSPELADLFERTCPKLINRQPAIRDPRTLEEVTVPRRDNKPGRGPSPVDRTWILELLALGIEDRIHRGQKFQSYELGSKEVAVHFTDGTNQIGSFLVGADGIRSRVRAQLQPERHLLDLERQILWGRTWLVPEFEKATGEEVMTWLAALDQKFPERNVIVEPIIWRSSLAEESKGRIPDKGSYVYWAFTTETPEVAPRTPEEMKTYIADHTQGWHPKVRALFDYADWPLTARSIIYSSKPDIGDFSLGQGLVTVFGDACHPVTPQGGLGGNTGARVAADLAKTLAEEGLDGVKAFEERMRVMAKEAIDISFATAKFVVNGREWDTYGEVDW